ncbi:hypothetical protein PC110_g8411 [Phytophthora cactorum]|uniref:Uncharacterized protein n=1 Tax=Phytophthora cactorum TaxID=29920 RepID=A0A329SEM3_9STRA|nr:hypothetical protein PC110_g8411 [Phytophthora cactorum]
MDEADAPAAAQISQADIIERQAETIARLKKQVQKGSEYKQLTKAKLKEAAARLKEYRIRVETLLRAEETLKQQLKTEQTAHAKTKKLHKSTLNQVKAKKHAHAATQTDEKRKATRTSQTLLSGDVERVNKKTMVDSGVQTTQMDQMVPKLSRHSPKETLEDTLAINEEPLQLLGGHTTTFPHETSAALDAELAFSDSDAESGETGDTLKLNSIVESGENPDLIAFNPTFSSKIDKELEFSEEEEDAETKKRVDSTAETQQKANERADSSLLGRVDAAVQSEIDKELESSSDEEEEVETRRKRTVETSSVERKTIETGEKTAQFDALDPAIANEIDRDLETSSDEEDSQKTTINAANNGQKSAVRDDDNGRAVMSIDDELDGEFAALESDSEPENGEKKLANGSKHDGDSSSSSSSSDSDSSDGSDSDSDEDGDYLMAGTVDKTPVQIAGNISPGPVEEKGNDQEPSTTDAVVIATPVEEKPVTVSEEMYSPVVEAESSSQTLKSLQLDTTTAGINHSEDKEVTSAVGSQQSPVQKGIPDPPHPTMTIDGAVLPPVIDSPSPNRVDSPRSPVSTQPAVPIPSDEEDKPTAPEVPTSSTSESLDLPPLGSSRTTEPGELVRSSIDEAKRTSDAQAFKTPSPTKSTSLGKVRKADEAELSESQSSSLKKTKREEVSSEAKSSTDSKTKKPAESESKNERRMRKSLTLFKQAIVLSKGEEADSNYARRTITVLVNQSSRFIDTLVHVTTLCQVLADTFRELELSPIEAVRGALGVFRTPRSRRLLQESKLSLSWLCNQVLLRLVSPRDASDSQNLSNIDESLLHLRGFLVEERANLGDFLSSSKVQVQISTQHVNVSHDKVFLAHICALHTHLCRSTGQLSRSRVLLFDIVRDNPDIRGLYFAVVMLEIYPAMLEREFDQQCNERPGVLKETLQQAFIVISSTAAAKKELLLHQSSLTMLHRIADAIQKPELELVDSTDRCIQKWYVHKLYDQVKVQDANYFELAKALEMCTAVYGLDLVSEIFSIDRCRELFTSANIEAKSGILSLVGHIATTVAPKTSDTQNPRTRSDQFVESAMDWLYELLSSQTFDKVSEDHFKLLVTCSKVSVDLILDYPAAAGLNSRRRVLCAIVNWFESTPSAQLMDLPAAFLRRLRLVVVAARPQMVPI